MANVKNHFEQPGSDDDNALVLGGTVKGADGTQPVAIADATDAATAISQLNLALAALRNAGIIAT